MRWNRLPRYPLKGLPHPSSVAWEASKRIVWDDPTSTIATGVNRATGDLAARVGVAKRPARLRSEHHWSRTTGAAHNSPANAPGFRTPRDLVPGPLVEPCAR